MGLPMEASMARSRTWFTSSAVVVALLVLCIERGGDGRLQLDGMHLACLVGLELLEELVEVEEVVILIPLLLALLRRWRLRQRWWCTTSSVP
jgi:hypothetical protein